MRSILEALLCSCPLCARGIKGPREFPTVSVPNEHFLNPDQKHIIYSGVVAKKESIMKKYHKPTRKKVHLKRNKIFEELRSVMTIDLAYKAEGIIGKLFWSTLGFIGILWAIYFISLIVLGGNPIVTSVGEISLREIEKPAISFRTKGTPKSAFAERLGNFISPEKDNLPEKVKNWIRLMMLCGSVLSNPTKVELNKHDGDKKFERKVYSRRKFLQACDKDTNIPEGCKVISTFSIYSELFNKRAPTAIYLEAKISQNSLKTCIFM